MNGAIIGSTVGVICGTLLVVFNNKKKTIWIKNLKMLLKNLKRLKKY